MEAMSSFEVSTIKPGQQQLDKHGERIIIEGICAQTMLKRQVSWYYRSLSLSDSICFPCLPCCIFLGRSCGSKAVDIWHMHLTSTTLHIVNFNPYCVCCPKKDVDIELMDINEIEEVGAVYRAGCCNLGTKLESPSTVRVELKPNKAKEFFWSCCRSCDLPLVIDINYCENATEVVEAVRQEMNKMQRE